MTANAVGGRREAKGLAKREQALLPSPAPHDYFSHQDSDRSRDLAILKPVHTGSVGAPSFQSSHFKTSAKGVSFFQQHGSKFPLTEEHSDKELLHQRMPEFKPKL